MSHPSPSLGASQQSASTYFSIDPCSLEVQGVPPHQSHHQTPCSAQTAMTNYDLFPTSSFNCNFPRNDNQTFNVCTESTLSIYRKGLCTFFRFWNSPRKIFYINRSVETRGSVALAISPKGRSDWFRFRMCWSSHVLLKRFL